MKQIPVKNFILLLLTAIIWGTAFVAQSVGMDYMGPFTFSAIRFLLGGLFLIPVVLVLRNRNNKKITAPDFTKHTVPGGVLCGVVLCVASNLQQFGVMHTTVGKTGFITALYIIFVPIISLFMKKKSGAKLWVSVVIAVVGLYLLCMTADSMMLTKGDTLVFLCAIVFSAHILMIDHFSPKADGVMMSLIQFLVAGAISSAFMLGFETLPSLSLLLEAKVPILYAGILSCGVAYTLQIMGQKNSNPTIASLILSLEAVIAVIAAWVILNQSMTPREITGAALMFAAIILAQLPARTKMRTAAELRERA